jgi:hypothetical protein
MIKFHTFFVYIFLFAISACATHSTNKSDFDVVCDIVKENIGLANPDEISDRVLNTLDKNSKAAIAFKTVATVAPSEKYKLFKQIAEQETGKPWNCPEMEKLNRENR